tara:strand:- start:44 stop:1135 length:1092 start_codon:yes stop_codon:yes gene_type:complete
MSKKDKGLVSGELEEAFYVSIDTMLPMDISDACQKGEVGKVKAWLGNGGSIRAEDPHGETLLHVACSKGEDVNIVEMLIRRGAGVNQRQSYTGGSTPLMAVAESGGSKGAEIALRLMAAGANKELTRTDTDEQMQHTAVMLAKDKMDKEKNENPNKLAEREIKERQKRFDRVIEAIGNRDAAPAIKVAEMRAREAEKEGEVQVEKAETAEKLAKAKADLDAKAKAKADEAQAVRGAKYDKLGSPLTYAASEAYAAKKGGRLLTLEEAKALIGDRPLYSGEDQWCAVTCAVTCAGQGRDWVQVGNGNATHPPGKSHVKVHGYPPWGDDANDRERYHTVALYTTGGGGASHGGGGVRGGAKGTSR